MMFAVRRFAFLVAVVVLAACGGDANDSADRPADRNAVGEPVIATNDRGARADVGRGRRDAGALVGTPALAQLGDLPPPVRLGTRRAGCIGTALQPNARNLVHVRRATLCLVNAERAARGLRPLRGNPRLAGAARRHARDMVSRGYFSHTSRSGASFLDRIRNTGYTQGRRAWTVGENLAWGTGMLSTPGEIVPAWMASPSHRANVLNGEFREIGIGIALGAPESRAEVAATYNIGFGARS